MRTKPGILAAWLAGVALLPVSGAALGLNPYVNPDLALDSAPSPAPALAHDGQSFAAPSTTPELQGAPAAVAAAGSQTAADTPESQQCADGQKAINQGRWADAVKIFSEVASQHGDHADGALYWMAYAENKLGESKPSEATCAELRAGFPKSRWIEDCGALLVEIHAKSGKPIVIEPGQSDDVKLLALSAMLHQDEPRALAEIQTILNGDASEKLKKEAQFILGQHYSNVTYPQIVRISYVEGDVRIQRGAPNGKSSGAVWEKAVADLPLETGFSLVTGAGRAEIEFENASTLYLGENSVLTFNDLHETAGVPWSDLALLSGTVSMYIHPYVAGEKFILRTPSNDLVAHYPDRNYARVQSYTDAVSITPLEGGDVRPPGMPREAEVVGRTFTWVNGQLTNAAGTLDDGSSSAWDQWVADRVAKRAAATAAVLEASGLTAPIPGMAEMAGQGKFFECAPYGTCWEPNADAAAEQASATRPSAQPHIELAAYQPAAQAAQAGAGVQPAVIEHEFRFPCIPASLRYRTIKDPVTGKQAVVPGTILTPAPYDWAVCHAGSWIRHQKHYVWVAGGKRRHTDPVRWVKSGRQVAFVPLHPYDVKGQPAINARHWVFVVTARNDITVRSAKFEPNLPIEYLKSPPREFRVAPLRPLAPSEAPRMEAHAFPHASGSKGVEGAAVPIHFDAKSQSFMVAKLETRAGRSTTVFAPMTNRYGSLQTRGPSYSGSSGARTANGSTAASSHGTASSAANSSHSGSSSSAASSSSASAAAASSAAAHH
jgi:hypothetical protein